MVMRRGRRAPTRPSDEPIYTNPSSMDFEKRRIMITQVSGTTVLSLMPAISNAIVCFEDSVVSHNNNVVYQL